MTLKHIIFFPGYLLLWIAYISPQEWGKPRNVAKSSRQWANRDYLAPIYSILVYGLIIVFAMKKMALI